MTFQLQNQFYSLAHNDLLQSLANTPRFLIIQDLDGVCMGLVRDPKLREMDPHYIHACKALSDRFFVLTNGEHTGSRGVNVLVEQCLSLESSEQVKQQGLYLPGLAAGGVQYQDCYGSILHPGVSGDELVFLNQVPAIMESHLRKLLEQAPFNVSEPELKKILNTIVLDNLVSPTVNIGSLYDYFAGDRSRYQLLQNSVLQLMGLLLEKANERGLTDSFFVHLAPNMGTNEGVETMKPATDSDMGTTDFQFMLQGAVKEVGVAVLLNHYYFIETGEYPLGSSFNARTAPKDRKALLDLIEGAFDHNIMPRMVGVGDTVTSTQVESSDGSATYLRGGSDRGFLTLVQELGHRFASDNAILFVDSSRGALKRPGIDPLPHAGDSQVPLSALKGITDQEDELKLNFLFPGGHQQYIEFFKQLAQIYQAS